MVGTPEVSVPAVKPLATVGPWQLRQLVTPWCTPAAEYCESTGVLACVWHWLHAAEVGMCPGGCAPPVALVANVGVVLWQLAQSGPVCAVGCEASRVEFGRESPGALLELATIPR